MVRGAELNSRRSRTTGFMLAVALLLGSGCEGVAEFEWSGRFDMGTVQSAEWIRFTTTDDYTFSGELTLNYFVLSNVPNLCSAYQTAVADSFDMHTRFLDDRAAYQQADDMDNPELCLLTKQYYENLGAATADLAKAGRAYLSTSFGYSNIGILGEEGQPQEGTFNLSADMRAEDGDFFRAYLRFFHDNPFTVLADNIDCAASDWPAAGSAGAFTEFKGEPSADASGAETGTLDSTLLGDAAVHLTHNDVSAVTTDRSLAGVLSTDGEYMLCELRTHGFFLRIFER